MTLYDDLGGFDALLAVCVRWHQLCLADPVAAHPFEHSPDQHPQHDERLAAYLAEATGGPPLYTAGYGEETSMQRLHAGNGVYRDMDEVCTGLFDEALRQCGIPEEPANRLANAFRAATEAMNAYADGPEQVPDGLPMQRWS